MSLKRWTTVLDSILSHVRSQSLRSARGIRTYPTNSNRDKLFGLQWIPLCHFSIRPCHQAASTEASNSEGKKSPEEVKLDSGISEANLELKNEVEKLGETVLELQDKYKRSLAEYENLRKRMQKQIEDAKLFGIQSFTKDLLEVADILHKATESIPESELSSNNPHLKNLYEGLRMTEAQLLHVFKRHNIAQINPIGEKFDPNQHEALFEQVVEGKPAGVVCIVTKIGYKLKERTIRPALVGVTK